MKLSFKLFKGICSQLLEQNTKQLNLYKQRYRSRKSLLKLDENMLRDIGISKEQAEEEANKSFWVGDDFKAKYASEVADQRTRNSKRSLIKASG
ncbi:DUF1127 domain-containing protein [uncultured Cocleimonas sp.]|uniref:DUF1127 domain-containing protein n=1 Tax=uncultured Cocleimonas sp. TaxID=1051587 RepID=UPI00260B762F|nr:DUF1127 domain-containing protein [uncultured Cocleimonas sp.]